MKTKSSLLSMLLCFLLHQLLLSCTGQQTINVHTLGDSTMEQQDPNIKDQRGWPQLLQPFFTGNIKVMNHGKSGTSTKTFYKEGFWTRAKATIKPGDYVCIQFGHNDGKHDGLDGNIGTAPTDSFKIYLSRFVGEVREMGAHPILFTPIVRRMFAPDGKLNRRGNHDLGEHVQKYVNPDFDSNDTITYNYVYNMKCVADSLQCPLIDLTRLTAGMVNAMGPAKAAQLIYTVGDDSHIGASGAALISRLAAEELKRQHILEEYIRLPVNLAIAPEDIKMGSFYIGTSLSRVFDVCCLEENGTTDTLNVSVNNGLVLSTEENGSYNPSLSLPYTLTDDLTYFKLFVKSTPERIGAITGEIWISNGKSTQKLSVHGECISLENSQSINVSYKLYNHSKPSAEGPVIALPEEWSGMEMTTFIRPRELGITDPDNKYYNTKVQCNIITGKEWPGREIDVVYDRYVQFGLQAIKGSTLHIDEIILTAGGGADYRIVCSKNKDFANVITLGERAGNGDPMLTHTLKTSQIVNEGEDFYIRIYPWSAKNTTNCYLCLHNVQIMGMQTRK